MTMKNKHKKAPHSIKPLMPSLREKKRFLVFQVEAPEGITPDQVSNAVMDSFHNLFGVSGCAEAGLLMLTNKYQQKTQKGMIRVNHRNVDKLRTALCFVRQIGNERATIRSVGLSGILQKAEKKFL